MRCNAAVQEAWPVTPEGEYEGVVVGIRDIECCYGTRIHIRFVLSGDGRLDGNIVSGIADKILIQDMELGLWIAAILGRMPEAGEEVTFHDLLHRKCRLVIRHRTNARGQVFATVVNVCPVNNSPESDRDIGGDTQ